MGANAPFMARQKAGDICDRALLLLLFPCSAPVIPLLFVSVFLVKSERCQGVKQIARGESSGTAAARGWLVVRPGDLPILRAWSPVSMNSATIDVAQIDVVGI